ncbi:hypothetical protein K438DRAFT_1992802 [Mycena galopus ATCC 62051]|nr:hypothetical protein K438DRAFT_1992802 [Mycena galopus ATCC 62051]
MFGALGATPHALIYSEGIAWFSRDADAIALPPFPCPRLAVFAAQCYVSVALLWNVGFVFALALT